MKNVVAMQPFSGLRAAPACLTKITATEFTEDAEMIENLAGSLFSVYSAFSVADIFRGSSVYFYYD